MGRRRGRLSRRGNFCIDASTMPNRIAVLVLACASPPYDRTVAAIRRTWGSVLGLDIYYLYGNPHDEPARGVLSRQVGGRLPVVEDDAISQRGDVLVAGCADHIRQQEDCILRKRLLAFDHLAADDRYDLIYSVCAASYVDQRELVRFADSLNPRRMMVGAVGVDTSRRAPFVSGASTILSVDIARQLGSHRREIIAGNAFGFRDDVTIGHWVATHLSDTPLATFIDDVDRGRPMTEGHVFVRYPQGTVGYVLTPAEDQRPIPNAFHYHFHSERADHMLQFHERYFT
jgi:hypothetical protein